MFQNQAIITTPTNLILFQCPQSSNSKLAHFYNYSQFFKINQFPTLIMVRQSKLSRTFRSIKPHSSPISNPNPNPNSKIKLVDHVKSEKISSWCVYLIASTNPSLKTYVGVTTDFSRRLKQHNGELKGGAKASRAGRPWICACLVQGFRSRSEACEFESKWKHISRKLPRKQKSEGNEGLEEKGLLLLQHRHAAMEKLKHSFDFDHLEIDWRLNP